MASATASTRQAFNHQTLIPPNKPLFSAHLSSLSYTDGIGIHNNHIHIKTHSTTTKLVGVCCSHRNVSVVVKSSLGKDATEADEEGVSLGTMKLPLDTNIPRFEILLFQWANSLNQGAQLPLPCPLKVDKIDGGVRLGFVEIDDGKTQVRVYIDCQVFSQPPMFRATRRGVLKDKVPPGEPRIMKSLLAALKKSVEIASV